MELCSPNWRCELTKKRYTWQCGRIRHATNFSWSTETFHWRYGCKTHCIWIRANRDIHPGKSAQTLAIFQLLNLSSCFNGHSWHYNCDHLSSRSRITPGSTVIMMLWRLELARTQKHVGHSMTSSAGSYFVTDFSVEVVSDVFKGKVIMIIFY